MYYTAYLVFEVTFTNIGKLSKIKGLPEDMYEEVSDSGRGQIGVQGPQRWRSLTTPLRNYT